MIFCNSETCLIKNYCFTHISKIDAEIRHLQLKQDFSKDKDMCPVYAAKNNKKSKRR
ncbi:MAG: hypothetical protein K0R00_57 [Herbinix sp.]|jgi:hypothetical protein|nr:hypothetical protein [Herbinix sp.]